MEDHICKGKAKAWWYSSKWCSSQQQGWVELCSSQRWPGRKIPNDSKRPLPAFFLVFSECWPKVKSEYKNLPHWRGRGRRWKMLRKIWRIKRGPVNLMEDTCASCDHFVKDVKLECHSALASDIFIPICVLPWWAQPIKVEKERPRPHSLEDHHGWHKDVQSWGYPIPADQRVPFRARCLQQSWHSE